MHRRGHQKHSTALSAPVVADLLAHQVAEVASADAVLDPRRRSGAKFPEGTSAGFAAVSSLALSFSRESKIESAAS